MSSIPNIAEKSETELRDIMKRCPEFAIQAAVEFHQTKDPALVAPVVMGIIERFVEPGVRSKIHESDDQMRLVEDLGVDSLLMVEIVMVIEESLGITIDNEDLRGLRSLGDVKEFLGAKMRGEPSPLRKRLFGLEQIAATMPHKHPFLFLQEVRLNGQYAEGTYTISGDESFVEAHFPGDPMFPASLMIEALGQLAVFFILRSERPELNVAQGTPILFVSCDGVRCHRICRPGETLNLRVELSRVHSPIVQFSGVITSGGVRVAKVEELSLGIHSITDED